MTALDILAKELERLHGLLDKSESYSTYEVMNRINKIQDTLIEIAKMQNCTSVSVPSTAPIYPTPTWITNPIKVDPVNPFLGAPITCSSGSTEGDYTVMGNLGGKLLCDSDNIKLTRIMSKPIVE